MNINPIISNDERISKILNTMLEVSAGNFETRLIPSGKNDEIDALMVGVNMLSEEIKTTRFDLDRLLKEKTDKLTETEIKFGTLADFASEQIFIINKNFVFDYLNESAAKSFNASPNNLIGKSLDGLFPPAQLEIMKSQLSKIFNTGITINDEREFKFNHNSVWLSTSLAPVYSSDKSQVVSVLGISRDITERKQAERELKGSQKRFQDVTDNMQEWIWETDAEGKYTYASQVVTKILGYTPEEMLQKHFYDIFHPEDREAFKAAALAAFTAKQPFRDFVNRNIHKEGHTVWLSTSGLPLFDDNGNLLGYRGADIDITERKRLEVALKDSRDDLSRILNSIAEGAYGVDTDGNCTFVNRSFLRILGYQNEQEVLGINIHELIHHSHNDGSPYPLSECRINGACSSNQLVNIFDEVFWRKDGVALPIEYWSYPIEKDGAVIGTITTFIDITERRRALGIIEKTNDELTRLNAEKDKLFSIIAHDLRSPFQGLIGITELMSEDIGKLSVEETVELAKEINISAHNLYKLLLNLFDWAQVQRGILEFSPKDNYLKEIVNEVINTINIKAVQKQITVTNSIPEFIRVFVDENMIKSVFRNLLSNSIKFTLRGGRVVVDAKEVENKIVEISVHDTGIGMSDYDVKRLFKINEKVSSKGTEGELSTGLGLLLCKEFVEKHGGRIWVASKENVGSTFYFTL